MDKPTAAQEVELWEWCGLKTNTDTMGDRFYLADGEWVDMPIDLNNLFKYAVPKVLELGYHVDLCDTTRKNQYRVEIRDGSFSLIGRLVWNEDPALALFWALYSVLAKTP